MTDTKPQVYTSGEVAEILRGDVELVYRLVKAKLLKPLRGRQRPFTFSATELDRYLRDEPQQPAPEVAA